MIFSLIPLPYKIAGGALLALTAWGAWELQWSRGYDAGVSYQQGEQTKIDLKREQTATAELTKRRIQDAATAERIQRAEDEAFQAKSQQRADKVILDAASGALQRRYDERVRALVTAVHATAAAGAGRPGDTGIVSSGETAEAAAGMLADVFRRCRERIGLLAAIADERGTAGATCERSYDALTQPRPE